MTGRRGRRAVRVGEPGDYGDGPVYLRVNRREAGRRWPVCGFEREVNDHDLENDPVHDWVYVPANSRVGHAYRAVLVDEYGIASRAIAVVRYETISPDE